MKANQFPAQITATLTSFINNLQNLDPQCTSNQDAIIQKYILGQILPLASHDQSIFNILKDVLNDAELESPRKYIVLMYLSLVEITRDRVSDLFKFFYELVSEALKQLKQRYNRENPRFWEVLFEKIYQYSMLLLIGSKSVLLSVQSLGMRVNTQMLSDKAKQMRLSRLVKIYNALLCIPTKYLTLKQTLYLTLIFTRWQLNQSDYSTPSFFGQFISKTQKKLIRKIQSYPSQVFNQEHILNLVKIVLGGDELIFSFFLQIKYSYEAIKINSSCFLKTESGVFEAMRKCPVQRESRHLFNFIIELLMNFRQQQAVTAIERQSIMYVCLKFLSGKYDNNESLFIVLCKGILQQQNQVIFQISFRFISEQALQYLTVHKVKILLNLFNNQNWQKFLRNSEIHSQVILNRLQRVIGLLVAMARRYSENSLVIQCDQSNYGIQIKNAKSVKSVIAVVCFEGVGLLNESGRRNMQVIRVYLSKSVFYQVTITFAQVTQSLISEGPQSKERAAFLTISNNKKELLKERKQYLKYGEGCFQSLISFSVTGKEHKSIAFCIDGAYYEIDIKEKSQIVGIQVGNIKGSVRSFYALKTQIDQIKLHKVWCEWDRKVNFVVDSLGTQHVVYKLNSRLEPVVLDLNTSTGFSVFYSKTEFKIGGLAVKNVTFMDLLLQLGGLETIFFIMQRFSQSLLHFKECEDKINIVLADFFNFVKVSAILDESMLFLDDILSCFQYLNQFLFLLVKRNKMVRDSQNSALLLSIFEMLIYFRKDRVKIRQIPNNLKYKMAEIEVSVVLKTLTNFEIWSNCTVSLQQFVLSRIKLFIQQQTHKAIFIIKDLHKQLLANVMLFSHHSHIHQKLIELCILLYQKSKIFVLEPEDLKEIAEENNLNYEPFILRDCKTCLCLIQAITNNKQNERFLQSEQNTFRKLIEYFVDNFICNTIVFQRIQKVWNQIAFTFCTIIKQVSHYSRSITESCILVIISEASVQKSLDIWIAQCFQSIVQHFQSTFINCFWLFCFMLSKYQFNTPRKQSIFTNILKQLISKLRQTKQSLEDILDFKQILNTLTPDGLYYLTTYRQFQQLFTAIKNTIFAQFINTNQALSKQFQNNLSNQLPKQKQIDQNQSLHSVNSQQLRKIWIEINQNIIHSLYAHSKINNLNKNFVKMTIIYFYQAQKQHKLAVNSPRQLLLQLEQVRQLAKATSSTQDIKYAKYGFAPALALIEHCKCWSVLYFLLQNQLITTEYDLAIPFEIKSISSSSSGLMAGTLGYYLSSSCSGIQLYAIFMTILYKQLSNSVSLLTTQSGIVIFQYCIEYLFQKSTEGQVSIEQTCNIEIIFDLLKQVIKSLNVRFIIRVCSIQKDIEKLLGKVVQKKHSSDYKNIKKDQILQSLVRVTNRMQTALEEDKVDRDVSQFLQNILDKLTIIQPQQPTILQEIALLVDPNTKQQIHSQTQLRKLACIGIRFFQVARDFNLSNYHEAIFVSVKHNKNDDKLPQLSGKEAEHLSSYVSQLTQKFDSILLSLSARGQESERKWDELLITNEHWFELQEDVDDVTTKFYEVDEKQIGPYGFYRLNIRPVKTDHQQLPYPRRKEFLEMMSRKKEEKQEPSLLVGRLTIENVSSNLYSKLSQSTNIREKSIRSRGSTFDAEIKNNSTENKYYCELITTRGAYAGTLSRNKAIIEFNYIGHGNLPAQRVYQLSTKCHRIESLLQWQEKEFKCVKMLLKNCKIFTRRYILRHTAIEINNPSKHRTYFFNLFEKHTRTALFNDLKNSQAEIIQDRVEAFSKAEFTQKWRRGEINNFQYLSLINQYSGRTFNDLAQYPVMPWVITNYDGQNGFNEINKEFYKAVSNLRDLSLPAGKLNGQKFQKLKVRLQQVGMADRQIRFLYGSMYSNPTVLYNFFIRLEPFTSLHWEHQGRRIDHADRLFSGIAENFSTVLNSSSDNKELAPQFYYWTQFLKNRNKIELGRRQRGDEVDAVVLPPWARSPEQFVFKMREVLQSRQVSAHLHEWIDLIFGYKAPYDVAEKYDNLYHYQCYEHDLFEAYETESEMKIAQITISEFGQIPEQLFRDRHPARNKIRDSVDIDTGILVYKGGRIRGFQHNEVGLLLWSDEQVVLKKTVVAGLFHSYEWSREYVCYGRNYFLQSIIYFKWIATSSGVLRLVEKGKDKIEKIIQCKCIDVIGAYCLLGCGSKLAIVRLTQDKFQPVSVLYGHRDEIVLIKTDHSLDVIVSVDRSGLVLVHELTELRLLRAFEIGSDLEQEKAEQLRLCVHQMGYYIFFDHDQTIWIFNFMGELILQQEFEVRAGKSQQERITDIQILSHEHSILLMASSRGNIFQVNFLEVIRFRDLYPFKTYSRLQNNILSAVRNKKHEEFADKAILQLTVVKCSLQTGVICQLLVLYESGQVVCYTEQKQLGKQLQNDDRLKSMGFF